MIEDQVTYPLTTVMLSVPRSKVVRGFLFIGVSFVYVDFEEETDIYWAQSRPRIPLGCGPRPAARCVYQYEVTAKKRWLAELPVRHRTGKCTSRSPRPSASPKSRASAVL